MSVIAGLLCFAARPYPRLGILRKIEKSFSNAIYHILGANWSITPNGIVPQYEVWSFHTTVALDQLQATSRFYAVVVLTP